MIEYSIYNQTTGDILRYGVAQLSEHIAPQVGAGESFVPYMADSAIEYIDVSDHANPFAVAKIDMAITQDKTEITANGIELVTFSNIPVGSKIGGMGVDDGTLEYTTDQLGINKLTIENNPTFISATIEVTGT